MYLVCTLIFCKEQAYTRNCSGSVCLDINLLKPCKIELVDVPAPLLCISDTQACPPKWVEYIYRTAHPVQGASGCAKSKVIKRKFEDQVDTERAPDADTADAAAANPATPATPPDAGAAAASGRGRSSRIRRGGASTSPQPWGQVRETEEDGGWWCWKDYQVHRLMPIKLTNP